MAAKSSQSPTSVPDSGRSMGRLYAELDELKDEALRLFNQYENDAAISDQAETARAISASASRVALALETIEEGLNQL